MVRAILDANLYISYLLSRRRDASAMGAILAMATAGKFELLFAAGIASEIRSTISKRPDLASALQPGDIETLMEVLHVLAESLPALLAPIPSFGRDPKDDYLIAHALAARAGYLVSWDKDLRDLQRIDGVQMVSPPEFLAVLREAPSSESANAATM